MKKLMKKALASKKYRKSGNLAKAAAKSVGEEYTYWIN